jgi:hypothetical protein
MPPKRRNEVNTPRPMPIPPRPTPRRQRAIHPHTTGPITRSAIALGARPRTRPLTRTVRVTALAHIITTLRIRTAGRYGRGSGRVGGEGHVVPHAAAAAGGRALGLGWARVGFGEGGG